MQNLNVCLFVCFFGRKYEYLVDKDDSTNSAGMKYFTPCAQLAMKASMVPLRTKFLRANDNQMYQPRKKEKNYRRTKKEEFIFR